jgi:hypothetical protein
MSKRHSGSRAHRVVDYAAHRSDQCRALIAFEAARLISEEGIRDYAVAKHKAAARLGVDDDFTLPKNSEIEAALREHQRLFHGDDQPRQLRALRNVALHAMAFFSPFHPRLVGSVLDGTADAHSAVCLHVFSDDIEAPARFLDEHAIAYEQQTRRLRVTHGIVAEFSVLQFAAEGSPIDLTVFDLDGLRQPPLDRNDGLPMRRATLAALQLLLDEKK